MLCAGEIEARATDIFAEGFESNCLQSASYELRIATTKMILPDGTRIPEGKTRTEPFHIDPGGVAFVSSMERIHIPQDLCGMVSIKFTFASRGVLMLLGMNVDPGYGSDDGEGRRLHFILANVGQEEITLVPASTPIASLQFFQVTGVTSDRESVTRSTAKSPKLIEELFQEDMKPLGLSLFEKPLEGERRLEGKLAELDSELSEVRGLIDYQVKGASQVITFGYFLLGTALLGVVLTALLSWSSNDTLASKIHNTTAMLPSTGWGFASLVAILAALAICIIVPYLLRKTPLRRQPPEQ